MKAVRPGLGALDLDWSSELPHWRESAPASVTSLNHRSPGEKPRLVLETSIIFTEPYPIICGVSSLFYLFSPASCTKISRDGDTKLCPTAVEPGIKELNPLTGWLVSWTLGQIFTCPCVWPRRFCAALSINVLFSTIGLCT
jgi:hypothetical protein